MVDALSIALSGLVAQSQRLAATASNIANASTTGIVPSADPSAPASTVYKPLQVTFLQLESGGIGAGVTAVVTPDPDGYTVVYDPESIYANSEGLIAAPNVDYANELVNLIEIKLAYRANISVIKTQDAMIGDLLDEIA
ncbi:MAG: flagellar basal body rod protein FlgC [Alphaproteobacteria bacterium]